MNQPWWKQRQHIATWRSALLFAWVLPMLALSPSALAQVVAVDAPGFTVSDAGRSIAFFEQVLSFEKVSDSEVTGTEYEHLQGVFGVRMRIVRMKAMERSASDTVKPGASTASTCANAAGASASTCNNNANRNAPRPVAIAGRCVLQN